MHIIKSKIFADYPEIIFGFSTKIGFKRPAPFHFNMSHTVGDVAKIVEENRAGFYKELGLANIPVAFQKQIHSDIIRVVDSGGSVGESDALITDKLNLGLAVSSADCTAIFIYDKRNKVIAAVHSGWRGTQQKILKKTLKVLGNRFHSRAEDLIVYIAPSISQANYEVGEEVADQFDEKYILRKDNSIYLDVAGCNYDMLIDEGVIRENIEISSLCSFSEKDLLHSYRREGKKSGRAWGIIAITD